MIEILYIGFACGFLSYTVTRGSIFDPIRDWFFHRSAVQVMPPGNTLKRRRRVAKIFEFIHGLISCPYCFSHWVAFLLAFIYRPVVVHSAYPIVDYGVSLFLIIGVSSISYGIYEKLTS